MNSPPEASRGGSQEAGFTQHRAHSFAQPCICKPTNERRTREGRWKGKGKFDFSLDSGEREGERGGEMERDDKREREREREREICYCILSTNERTAEGTDVQRFHTTMYMLVAVLI